MAERDEPSELPDLARAWSAIPAPEPPDELAELARREPETARAVEHLRELWARVEAPAPDVSFAPRAGGRRGLRRVAAWAVLAAAAAWLLVLGLRAFAPDASPRGFRGQGRSEETAARDVPAGEGSPEAPAGAGSGTTPGDARAHGTAAGGTTLVALTDQRIEMRSGPVRLILLTQPDEGSRTR